MTANFLAAAPVSVVAALCAWAFWDFLGIPDTLPAEGFVVVLLVGLGALVAGLRFERPPVRRAGLGLVALSYLGAHVFFLPLDPGAALAFVTFVLVAVELRIVADRFARILLADLSPPDRDRLVEALGHSFLRIIAASAIAYLGSYLTADLALSGTLAVRSIATALLLSMALIVVVLLIALWPLIERTRLRATAGERPIQTAK